jgi:hypothetical protein
MVYEFSGARDLPHPAKYDFDMLDVPSEEDNLRLVSQNSASNLQSNKSNFKIELMKVLEQNDFNFPVRCDAELGDSEPED